MSKKIRDIERLLEYQPKTITLRASTVTWLIERASQKQPVSDAVTGRLRRKMYQAEQSLRRIADQMKNARDYGIQPNE